MKPSVRKLQRMSRYSYCVILPKWMIEKYGWKEHQKLTVKDKGQGAVEIRDWKRK